MKILDSVGSRRGEPFGRYSDRRLYGLLLQGNVDVFVGMARELASAFVREDVDHVVGDSRERRILGHDVCRLVVGTAVAIASRSLGRSVSNYEFEIHGYLGRHPPTRVGPGQRFELDDEAIDWKLAAARTYPDPSLQAEVDEMLASKGRQGLMVEELRPVPASDGFDDRQEDEPPEYEIHGEALVAAGHYPRPIRYHEHVAPLRDALRKCLENAAGGG